MNSVRVGDSARGKRVRDSEYFRVASEYWLKASGMVGEKIKIFSP
ncbi:MAG: hypothetical protein V7L22_24070 [Nostoc sp.]